MMTARPGDKPNGLFPWAVRCDIKNGHLAQHVDGDGRSRLFELFPYGYVAQACKIAGMKRPRAWSTG